MLVQMRCGTNGMVVHADCRTSIRPSAPFTLADFNTMVKVSFIGTPRAFPFLTLAVRTETIPRLQSRYCHVSESSSEARQPVLMPATTRLARPAAHAVVTLARQVVVHGALGQPIVREQLPVSTAPMPKHACLHYFAPVTGAWTSPAGSRWHPRFQTRPLAVRQCRGRRRPCRLLLRHVCALLATPHVQREHRVLNRAVPVGPNGQSPPAETMRGYGRAVWPRRL
jgi:hypothetical protein